MDRSYVRVMNRILLLAATLWWVGGFKALSQESATEERLNKLSGHIEMLLASKAEQDKRIATLAGEIENLREQLAKPNHGYASTEDLRKLAEALKEIDQKRIEDNREIAKQIELIAKVAAGTGRSDSRPPAKKRETAVNGGTNTGTGTAGNEKGYEYEIAAGDTLSTIAEAYRTKGVKVTVADLLNANPGLKERSLKIGQKVFIPAP